MARELAHARIRHQLVQAVAFPGQADHTTLQCADPASDRDDQQQPSIRAGPTQTTALEQENPYVWSR